MHPICRPPTRLYSPSHQFASQTSRLIDSSVVAMLDGFKVPFQRPTSTSALSSSPASLPRARVALTEAHRQWPRAGPRPPDTTSKASEKSRRPLRVGLPILAVPLWPGQSTCRAPSVKRTDNRRAGSRPSVTENVGRTRSACAPAHQMTRCRQYQADSARSDRRAWLCWRRWMM